MEELNLIFVETPSGGMDITFVENSSAMIEITTGYYTAVAAKLVEAVGGSEFFSGSVHCRHEGFDSVLTATILVYRSPEQLPEGTASVISDIVPVWWEFSTMAPDGSEIINDFSFKELKKHFLILPDYLT